MKGNRRYRQKLVIRPQDVIKTAEDKKQLIRRDKNLDHVIISEKKDTTIAKYQVCQFCKFVSTGLLLYFLMNNLF